MFKIIFKNAHYLIIAGLLVLIIVNSIIAYYCKGVNSAILTFSIIVTLVVFFINIVTNRFNSMKNKIIRFVSVLLFILLCIITYYQSPRYSYGKAIAISDCYNRK